MHAQFPISFGFNGHLIANAINIICLPFCLSIQLLVYLCFELDAIYGLLDNISVRLNVYLLCQSTLYLLSIEYTDYFFFVDSTETTEMFNFELGTINLA